VWWEEGNIVPSALCKEVSTWPPTACGFSLPLCPSGVACAPDARLFWGAPARPLPHLSAAASMEAVAPGPRYLGRS